MGVASLFATESAPETGASSRYDAYRLIIITLIDKANSVGRRERG